MAVPQATLVAFTCTILLLASDSGACFRSEPKLSRISVRGKWLVDNDGRIRLFHGWNSVNKAIPWYFDDMLNDTKLDLFKEWGFNAVRLGAMWSGFEPTRGVFDKNYTAVMQKIVAKLESRGIYTLLDMHQDVISSKFGSYDGVPRWVIDTFPDSPHPYPWPLKKISQWAEGYLTEAVCNAFQCLYDNVQEGRDAMVKVWQYIASIFKDTTSVLGYELINEPWAGNIYKRPELLLPGYAGSDNLQPLYDVLGAGIRHIDNDTLIFFEPVTWGTIFNDKILGSGFSRVPGGDVYKNRSVYAFHYYCWLVHSGDNATQPYPLVKRILCDDLLEPKVFRAVSSEIERLGSSSFLTEFGVCTITADPAAEETIECEAVMRLADEYLQSWTYWDSQFFDSNGDVIMPAAKGFSRAYARAVAGIPINMSFDPATKVFILEFIPNLAIKAPTEIFVPPLHFPNGPKVTVSGDLSWTFDRTKNVVLVRPESLRLWRKGERAAQSKITIQPA